MRRLALALMVPLLLAAGPDETPLQSDIRAIEDLSALGEDAQDLPLGDAVRRALGNNLGLQVRVRELDAARSRLQASWGPFLPYVMASWGYNPKRAEQFREDFETWQRTNSDSGNYSLGAGVHVFTGTDVSLNWAQGTFGTTVAFDPQIIFDNPLDPDNPIPVLVDRDFKTRWAALSLTVNQNLLEGISPNYQLRAVRGAQIALDAADVTQRRVMAEVVGDVLKSYWDLVAARRLVEIERIDRRLAEEQRTVTQARIEAGDAAPIEMFRIDEQVAAASAALLEAERAAEEAEQQLKLLLGVDPRDPLYAAPIRPLDGVASVLPQRDREASLGEALEHNPELALQRMQVQADRIEWQGARHQMLPQLDANASLSLSGSDFEARDAVAEVFSGALPDFSVGMTFNMPVPDMGAIHSLRAAESDLAAAELTLEQTRRQVRAGVESAQRSIDSYVAQVEVARVRVDLAASTAEAAEATYEAGRNTLREVLEAQSDLKEARVALVQAEVAEQKARVDLEILRGSLLDALGVELQ